MLVIKEVTTKKQYDTLKEKQDLSINTYLYILKYTNSVLYVNQDGEYNLENTEEIELLKTQVNLLERLLDNVNRTVV